jgi:hypothetical protein
MKKEICPIIYKTTNLITNKSYTGKDLYNNPNYLGSGKILKPLIKKYGKNNFQKELVEKCLSIDHMNEREIYWIKELNTFAPHGYNINVGGKGGDTYTHKTDEEKTLFKENLRLKATGKKHTKETKELMSSYRRGKPQEKREIILCPYCNNSGDKLNFSRWHFDFCKDNPNRILKEIKKIECPHCHKSLNPANVYQWHFDFCKDNPNRILKKGHAISEESKTKISVKKTGQTHSEKIKQQISNSLKGIKRSQITKDKHRVNMQNRWKIKKLN